MLVRPQRSSYSICVPHRPSQSPISSLPVSLDVFLWNGFNRARVGQLKNERVVILISVAEERSSSLDSERKRKVVEHICLLKAKEDLSDEEERDMLDYLYTTQYQMSGIVTISLGRVATPNSENDTYALYMRFQRKENLAKFYDNPFYLKVLKQHVMTYCHKFDKIVVADTLSSNNQLGDLLGSYCDA